MKNMLRTKIKPLQFPKAGQNHPAIIEWWYFNGHLRDKKEKSFAFMDCLFKADVKRVKIPFLSILPFKTVYFAHSILSDIARQKSYPDIQNIALVSKDSFTKPLLFVNYTDLNMMNGYFNSIIEEIKPFCYHLKTENFDLTLESVKTPLLEGGRGFITVCNRSSYYYSLTNLTVSGTVNRNGKKIEVAGKAWMDHQWADVGYSKDKWNWFSIQLDSNTEIMCCEYSDGKHRDYLIDISYPDGRQESLKWLLLKQGEKVWESEKTKARYPLSWRIEIPERNIVLDVSAPIKNQEIIFGSINYWEGPLIVSGMMGNSKVAGVGFMELVGYPSDYGNVRYVRDEFGKLANRFFSYARNKTSGMVNDFFNPKIKRLRT